MRPETRYAKSGDVHIAYQVFGDGAIDVVLVHGLLSHLDLWWDWPLFARFAERLGSFARVITFDKRGVGLSDRVSELPSLEVRMDDVRAVMDAAESRRAVIFGMSEGAPMALLFAATYPDRVPSLVLHGGMARSTRADTYPFAPSREAAMEAMQLWIMPDEGGEVLADVFGPSLADDPEEVRAWARRVHASASPAALQALWLMALDIDVRDVLPVISCPTLVLHRRGDRATSVYGGRWLAEQIRTARFVELPGSDHFPWIGDQDAVLGEVEEFLTGVRGMELSDRVLLTVLFTDIVDSTQQSLVTKPGSGCSTDTTSSSASTWRATRDGRSTRPATAAWPSSTGPRAGCAARGRCWRRCAGWDWRSGRGCTPARSSSVAMRSPG